MVNARPKKNILSVYQNYVAVNIIYVRLNLYLPYNFLWALASIPYVGGGDASPRP